MSTVLAIVLRAGQRAAGRRGATRRTIAFVWCLVGLCLVACTALRGAASDAQAAGASASSSTGAELGPVLPELPVRVAYFDDGQFAPCYLDLKHKALYRWNGVVLKSEQLDGTPYAGVPSGIRVLRAGAFKFSVLTVEAPVQYWYWREGEAYRPGYLDRSIWTFYAWKGVALGKDELPEVVPGGRPAVVEPSFPGQVIGMLEIDAPEHLKARPARWKKGGDYTGEVYARAEKRVAEKRAARRKAAEERARDPRSFRLRVVLLSLAEDEYAPCYYDPAHADLYRWEGVSLRLAQVPHEYKDGKLVTFGARCCPCLIVPARPPVSYREAGGAYRPGYLDRTLGVFYEWKGASLRKDEVPERSEDGRDAVLKPDAFGRVIEIDVPARLKELPGLRKKE